ncbi:hypothetical protein DN752_18790 [Echinicola strongylocentroti]|uniref:Uncharacterized protein n=1 Tax=Echinicola strongylocentroti TaxID=1795355 RepID=A0A2Z4IN46_9BACT|nr:hypothetical protein [Echinicola strongylocentroti]AWW32016.1 hypothetical protein DN752_18790 [Echinicola strongylocentroti]
MDLLIKMKHYVIFLIIAGIPFITSLGTNITYLSGASLPPQTLSNINLAGLLIGVITFYLWIWSVILHLSKAMDTKKITASSTFSLALLVSFVFGILALFYFHTGGIMSKDFIDQKDIVEESPSLTIILAIILFISLSLLLISLNHLAYLLVMAERNREPHKTEYFSEFIMALVFPIGLWFLQPRIQKVLASKGLVNKKY